MPSHTPRYLLFLIISLVSYSDNFASDTIFTHVIREGSSLRVNFSDSIPVFIDSEGQYELSEILTLSPEKFTRPMSEVRLLPPFVVWSRIRLINKSERTLHEYFSVCNRLDSAEIYCIKNGQVVDRQITGSALRPSRKILPSTFNYSVLSVEPGSENTYYLKMYFSMAVGNQHLSHVYLRPGQEVAHRIVVDHAWQSLYAGVMLLFCLLGIFVFGVFRERAFLFLVFLMAFFALYFLTFSHLTDIFLDVSFFRHYFLIQRLIISGILIFGFLFVSRYIRLSTNYPKYYLFYGAFTMLAASFSHIVGTLFPGVSWIGMANNGQIFLWLILTLIPSVLLTRRGDRPAKVLLLSFVVLILFSLIHTFGLVGLISFGEWTNYGFQIGTVLFSGMVFFGLFENINDIRQEKLRVEELDQLKSRFFANISHEFRTPLTLVMGPLGQLMERLKSPGDQKLLQVAHRNAGRLLELINQLLDLSKLEAGKMNLSAGYQNFASLLKGIVMSFESLAVRKNIRLHFISKPEEVFLFVDREKVEKIFYNLLSNAFKFTKSHGEVSVLVSEQQTQVEVIIRDTGIGIPATRLSDVFNRFFQVDSSKAQHQEGTGIGLALAKELIELHHGEIRVESAEGKGTSFFLLFPKGKAHLSENEIVAHESLTETGETFFTRTKQADTEPIREQVPVDIIGRYPFGKKEHQDLPLVLIVEDNTDVRRYMKESLTGLFQIEEAQNGQEGVEKALELLPDLVISDVMMPEKDGYELCQTLKSDQRTSHIPIILLTAKAAREERLKGLETGADDYLLKPFDTAELQARVRNLIEGRLQLRKHFSDAPTLQPKSIRTNSVDKAFLEKVCAVIEAHLSDEQFGVEILASEVGMSRVHLNRKLKALTDFSPNKFIQAFRLQHALELLRQKKGNVSEIAFEVGFGSTAYFVKCFREKYGKTPGSMLED